MKRKKHSNLRVSVTLSVPMAQNLEDVLKADGRSLSEFTRDLYAERIADFHRSRFALVK